MERYTNKVLKILIFCIFFIGAKNSWSQGFSSQNSYYHNVISENGTEYILKVSLPYGYNESKSYKSVYYLDGFGMSDIILGANSILNVYDEDIEDLVYVGISYNGSREYWIEKRTFDYTPSKIKSIGKLKGDEKNGKPSKKVKIKYKTEGFELSAKTTGGGSYFLNYIEKTIIPFVDENYKNLSTSRTLIGHSFGGLFALHTLQTKPELFENYIMISGAISVNSSEYLENSRFDILENWNSSLKVFNCYGDLEPNITKRSNDSLSKILSDKKFLNVEYLFKKYEKEGHTSILKDAIYDGLKFIYKN